MLSCTVGEKKKRGLWGTFRVVFHLDRRGVEQVSYGWKVIKMSRKAAPVSIVCIIIGFVGVIVPCSPRCIEHTAISVIVCFITRRH